ncbi:MAG: uroporphyrinogen decarboxylase family protein [Anaerolineaceae bacterium]
MNRIERIRAVLAGQVPDRVPASFWFHFPAEQAHGEAAVKAHLDYFRQIKPDFLKIMNEHPYQTKVQIKIPSDWRKLKPAPLSSEFYQAQLDEIKQITDALKGECLTTTTIFNPFSSGDHASDRLVTQHLKEDPQSVNMGLAVIAESLAEFAVACLDAGADGIYFSAQGGEADRFSEHVFLEFIKPHDLTVLNAIRSKGELNIIHICRDNVRLHLYCNYPGHVFNWAVTAPVNLSLKSGKRLFTRPILGGLDNNGLIVKGKPEEIEHAVHEIIRSAGPANLIIGADCTLPTDINRENIRLAIEATGTYPMPAQASN